MELLENFAASWGSIVSSVPKVEQSVPRIELNGFFKIVFWVYVVIKQQSLLKLCYLVFIVALLVRFQTVHAPYTHDGRLFPLASPIKITSPSNITYSPGLLMLNISFKLMLNVEKTNITMLYSLDGKANVTFPVSATFFPVETTVTYENGTSVTGISSIFSYYIIKGSVALPELSEGFHRVVVYGRYERGGGSSFNVFDTASVYFTINDENAPVISNLSVENKAYSQENLPLNFVLDESTSWIGYCLDGQANVTMTENCTLIQLPSGSHTLTVYANDTVGNIGASEAIYFTIEEPFPTSLVITSAIPVTVVLIGIGLLVYRIKRK